MFGFALQNVQPPSETAYGKSDTEILGKRSQVSLVRRVELWEWKAESDFFFVHAQHTEKDMKEGILEVRSPLLS